MAVNEGNVATAALVIAISAFFIACGQLLQQFFATADGLRRCQDSVIGGWSQLVQLRFRWRSCRFEVKVTTPHFEIAQFTLEGSGGFEAPFANYPEIPLTAKEAMKEVVTSLRNLRNLHKCDASRLVNLVGTKYTYQWSVFPSKEDSSTEETVTWLSLIEDIHLLQFEQMRKPFLDNIPLLEKTKGDALHRVTVLSLTRKMRSWDFMPPDIVRPVASTTLGCIVSMVHRMDMAWVEFRPDEGIIRARGVGRSIAASRVRGLGLVIEYDNNGRVSFSSQWLQLPSSDADKMACGILPGFRKRYNDRNAHYAALEDLPLRIYNHPVMTQLARAFTILRLESNTLDSLRQSLSHKQTSQVLPGFADLLGLWSEWLPLPGHFMDVANNPFPVQVVPMGVRSEARVVWRWLLKTRTSDSSDQIKRIIEIYNEWEKSEPERFYTQYEATGNAPIIDAMRSFFEKIFYETKSYFDQFHESFYGELVRTHIMVNSHSLKQAEENFQTGHKQPRPEISTPTARYRGDSIFTERAFVYAENVNEICDALDPSKFAHEADKSSIPCIEEAWWMAMLRMQAWNMGIKLIMREGITVPYHYYGDPSRVYIL